MNIISRIKCITDLLEKIYGITTINYDSDIGKYKRGEYGTVIFNKNGLFDKNAYTLKYKNKFDVLFDITFNTRDCNFESLSAKGEKVFTRSNAIDNAIEYFKTFGIKVPIYFNNENDRNILSKLIYKMIASEILTAIFNTDDNIEKKDKRLLDYEDITTDFSVAINNIKNIFESDKFIEIMYANAENENVELVYEKKALMNDLNYFKLFSTENFVFNDNYNPCISLLIEEYLDDCNYILEDKAKKEFIDLIMKQKKSWDEIKNQAFDINKLNNAKKYICSFNFFDLPPRYTFLPHYFYYGIKVDNYILDTKYGECLGSNFRFNKRIREDAYKALTEKYKINFSEEGVKRIESIIRIIYQISNIDFKSIIDDVRHGNETISKTIPKDFSCMYRYLCDYGLESDVIITIIIGAIQYSVNAFCDSLEDFSFRTKDENKTLSWGMMIIIRDLYSETILNYVCQIEGAIKNIQKIIHFTESSDFINYNLPTFRSEGLKVKVTLGKIDKNNHFAPFNELEQDAFIRLHRCLLDIVKMLEKYI